MQPDAGKTDWMKKTVLFLGSQAISLFGSSLVAYAITWHITLSTQSGTLMTVSILCGFLPLLILSPFTGVWADRYHRKLLIALSDSFTAVVTLLLALVFMAGYKDVWLLFAALALRAVGQAIQLPAVGALLPQIVPDEKLTRVNAVSGSIQSVVMLASPMLSGALLSFASIESIFFIDVATAAVAVFILLALLSVPPHAKAARKQTTGYFADMKSGLQYIRNHSFIRLFLLFGAAFFFLASPVAFLSPLQVTRTFGGDVWRLTAIEVAFSAGMIAGGLAIAAWGGFKNKVHTVVLSCLMFGALTFALGVTPWFWAYLAFMLILGVAMPFYSTPATVLLQQKVEPDYMGRVLSILTMLQSAVMPLGMLVFGPLADTVRIEWMMVVTGLLMLVTGFAMLGSRSLVEAGRPAPAAEKAGGE
jgi:DHA3 family macrolide efflux protein-like MFS transporter